MSEFTITEDFPTSEMEFDKRFNNEQACRDYLAAIKWPEGFICRKCSRRQYWISAKHLYICTRCEAPHSLDGGHRDARHKEATNILV